MARSRRRKKSPLFLASFAAALILAFFASPLRAQARIIGEDERADPTPAEAEAFQGIGVIFPYDKDVSSTAFFIRNCQTVLTTSHGLFGKDGHPFSDKFIFYPGAKYKNRILIDLKREQYIKGTEHASGADKTEQYDYVFLRLAHPEPNCRPLQPAILKVVDQKLRLDSVAYHHDKGNGHELQIHRSCKALNGKLDLSRPQFETYDADSLIFHQCDTNGIASGHPLIAHSPDGSPRVVGIHVGGVRSLDRGYMEKISEEMKWEYPNVAIWFKEGSSILEDLDRIGGSPLPFPRPLPSN